MSEGLMKIEYVINRSVTAINTGRLTVISRGRQTGMTTEFLRVLVATPGAYMAVRDMQCRAQLRRIYREATGEHLPLDAYRRVLLINELRGINPELFIVDNAVMDQRAWDMAAMFRRVVVGVTSERVPMLGVCTPRGYSPTGIMPDDFFEL